MDLNEFLARTQAALAMPTLYWLGFGGWKKGQPAPPQPGTPINPATELAKLAQTRPTVHAKYMAAIRSGGIDLRRVPRVAADCSGFVTWALGVARNGSVLPPGGWINTDAIHADALGAQQLFRPLARMQPGALLVYPKPNRLTPGHVAIVLDPAAAKPVVHCAAENFLLAPAAGAQRNSIAATDKARFDADPRTEIVWWRGFDQ